jgi:hypothetical protein
MAPVKLVLLLWAFCVAAEVSFAGRSGDNSQTTSEVYALASGGTPLTWTVYAPAEQGRGPQYWLSMGGIFLAAIRATPAS